MSQTAPDKKLFRESCANANEYPECLIWPSTHRYNLTSYRRKLNEHVRRLFCPDGEADVNSWDYVDSSKDFRMTKIRDSFQLKGHFEGEHLFEIADPRCQFLFIGAPHSREVLKISREMAIYMLTYYQVMPGFLDFIFPFGRQEQAQDFRFSGFREVTHLLPSERNLEISELHRSGQDISMCYSLKGVEQSDAQEWPWSVRQTSVYHSFDVGVPSSTEDPNLKIGKALWIVLKANELIKRRIQSSASPNGLVAPGKLKEAAGAFRFSLEAHLIICEWSAENWRWYLNYLEDVLHDLTGRSLAIRIGRDPNSASEEAFHITSRRTFSAVPPDNNNFQVLGPPPFSRVPSYQPRHAAPPGPPPGPPPPPVRPPGVDRERPSLEKNRTVEEHHDFSFHDLQQVQYIEEKMNEVLLVLDSNSHVLHELSGYYDAVTTLDEWPKELANACTADVARFTKRIATVIKDLRMHYSRAETMLRVLEKRKNLLYGILEYRNTQANMLFTKRAQESTQKSLESADRMEKITAEMHEIAKKTERETVSMRIITLVTLFFLPGTFISTIMSTDIVKFPTTPDEQDSERVYHPAALNLYIAITLPMMVLTFGAWGVMYQWSKWSERVEGKKKAKKTEKGVA